MTSEFMAPTTSQPEPVRDSGTRRVGPVRRFLAPIKEASGLPKWVLYGALAVVAVYVILAVFAPLISPYTFDQYKDAAGHRFPKSINGGHPSAQHLFGTNVMST